MTTSRHSCSEKRATIEAVIFDLDGTLVDSNELHVAAWNDAFQHFGLHFPIEKLRDNIGKGSDQYLPEFLNPEQMRAIGKQLDEYRTDLFKRVYSAQVKPFPKVRELFQRIETDGKRIALATSSKKDDIGHYKQMLRIDDLLDCEITADDAEKSKPAADVFVAALKALRMAGDAAIVVGDTRFDIEAAGKAEIQTIAFSCGGSDGAELRRAGAIAVYRDPEDLLQHYEQSPIHC